MLVSTSPCFCVLRAKFVALLGLMWVRARKSSPCVLTMAKSWRLMARWASIFAEMRLKRLCRASLLCRVPGSRALLLAPLTRSCAAKPYWWHGGQPAQTATSRVNVRIGGPRHPPAGPRPPPHGLTRASRGPMCAGCVHRNRNRRGPEGFAGVPTLPMTPRIRQRRDPEGSRLSLRAVTAPSAPESRHRIAGSGWPESESQPERWHPGVSARASAQKQRPRRHAGCSVLPPALDGVDRVGTQVGQRVVGVDQAGG